MTLNVEVARQQWADAYRDLGRDRSIDATVREQVETVIAELRRRVGGTFTLGELAAAYESSEQWTLAAISERSYRPGWVQTASTAADAAFHLYARGARDYRP